MDSDLIFSLFFAVEFLVSNLTYSTSTFINLTPHHFTIYNSIVHNRQTCDSVLHYENKPDK